jgi:hypothetical protein
MGLMHRDMTGITAIGIDQISWRMGDKSVTLVYPINEMCKRLLYVGTDRTEASLRGYLQPLSEEVKGGGPVSMQRHVAAVPEGDWRIDWPSGACAGPVSDHDAIQQGGG